MFPVPFTLTLRWVPYDTDPVKELYPQSAVDKAAALEVPWQKWRSA